MGSVFIGDFSQVRLINARMVEYIVNRLSVYWRFVVMAVGANINVGKITFSIAVDLGF